MLIQGNRGKYEALVRFPDDELGETWLGRDEASRFVRVTELEPSRASDPVVRERFVATAGRAMSAVSANIEAPIDVGTAEGRPFAVHRHRHGVSLERLLGALASRGRRLAPHVSVAMFVELASALDEVHDTVDEQGQPLNLVHGAIRTERIVVAFDGQVLLTGLGLRPDLARTDDATREAARHAAPEAVRGESIDTRADIYSLASVLLEMLTMQHFDRALLSKPRESLAPDLAPALLDAILSALDERRDARPPTLDEFRAALLEAVPESADVALAKLAVLARTIVAQDVARGPIANTPSLALELERSLPAADESVLAALSIPLAPGMTSEFEERPGKRSVFGTSSSTPNRAARAVEAKPSALRTGVLSAQAPKSAFGSNVSASRPARKSVPPPRASKSTPPPAGSATPSGAASKSVPPPPRAPSPPRSPGPTVVARPAAVPVSPGPAWPKAAPKFPAAPTAKIVAPLGAPTPSSTETPASVLRPASIPPPIPEAARRSTPPPPPPVATMTPLAPPLAILATEASVAAATRLPVPTAVPTAAAPPATATATATPPPAVASTQAASVSLSPSSPGTISRPPPPPAFAPIASMVDPTRPFAPISVAPPPPFDPANPPPPLTPQPIATPLGPAVPLDVSSLIGGSLEESPAESGSSPLDVSSIAPPRPPASTSETTGAMRGASLGPDGESSSTKRFVAIGAAALVALLIVGIGIAKFVGGRDGGTGADVGGASEGAAAVAAPPTEVAPTGTAALEGEGPEPAGAANAEAPADEEPADEASSGTPSDAATEAPTTTSTESRTPRTSTPARMTSSRSDDDLSFRERRRLRRSRR